MKRFLQAVFLTLLPSMLFAGALTLWSTIEDGDYVTIEMLNQLPTAVNDNDSRITAIEEDYLTSTHESTYDHGDIATALQPEDVADTVDPTGDPNGLPDNEAVGDYVPITHWQEEKAYAANEIVANGGYTYTCIEGHTSDTSEEDVDEPGVGASWTTYWRDNSSALTGDKIYEGDTSVETTDTGSDGTVTIKADDTTVITITADGVTMPIIAADGNLDTDDSYSVGVGGCQVVTAGEAITALGTLVYYDTTAGEFLKADANASGENPAWGAFLGDTSDDAGIDVADGEDFLMCTHFIFYDTALTYADGTELCLSETAGEHIACSSLVWDAEDDCYQIVGTVQGTDRINFSIDKHRRAYHAAP